MKVRDTAERETPARSATCWALEKPVRILGTVKRTLSLLFS
ncbi:hypothetical protein X756_28065 [Mesorhizobium sp. LSHC412B00]|nr:hypothetical protein X756_28065 [Mesorhizobium sp. LSHC412B00]